MLTRNILGLCGPRVLVLVEQLSSSQQACRWQPKVLLRPASVNSFTAHVSDPPSSWLLLKLLLLLLSGVVLLLLLPCQTCKQQEVRVHHKIHLPGTFHPGTCYLWDRRLCSGTCCFGTYSSHASDSIPSWPILPDCVSCLVGAEQVVIASCSTQTQQTV
jgi:hypothetical protein